MINITEEPTYGNAKIETSEYGIKVKFPCLKINTPFGPVKIGGRCDEEAKIAQRQLEQVPPPSPIVNILPIVLLAGGALSLLLILRSKRS